MKCFLEAWYWALIAFATLLVAMRLGALIPSLAWLDAITTTVGVAGIAVLVFGWWVAIFYHFRKDSE